MEISLSVFQRENTPNARDIKTTLKNGNMLDHFIDPEALPVSIYLFTFVYKCYVGSIAFLWTII